MGARHAARGQHDDRCGGEHPETGGIGTERVGDDERGDAHRGVQQGTGAHDGRRRHQRDDGRRSDRPRQRTGAERKLAALREQQGGGRNGRQGQRRQHRQPPRSLVPPPRRERDGEDDRGDRACRRRRHHEDRGHDVAPAACHGERGDGDGQSKGERQTSDRHVDHRPRGEQQARRQRPPVASGQVVEGPCGDGAAGDGDGSRSDQRAEQREEHAVSGRVMAGEPQVVPDRRAGRFDELDAQQLRRPVGAAPSEDEGGGGQRCGEGGRGGVGPRPHQPTIVLVVR